MKIETGLLHMSKESTGGFCIRAPLSLSQPRKHQPFLAPYNCVSIFKHRGSNFTIQLITSPAGPKMHPYNAGGGGGTVVASAIPASSEGELRLGSRHRVPNRSFPGMPASLTCHSTLCRTHAQHCTLQSLSWTLRPTCSWRVNLHLPLAIMIGQLTGNRPGA